MVPVRGVSGSTELLGLDLGERHYAGGLMLLPPEPGTARILAGSFDRLDVLHHDHVTFQRDEAEPVEGVRHRFAPLWPENEEAIRDAAVLYYPKDRDRAQFLLSDLGRRMTPGAPVFVVGPTRGGIRSAPRLIEASIGPVFRRRSARHCLLLEARSERTVPLDEGRQSFTLEAWGITVTVISRPGVFAHGRLDAGTRFLLDTWMPETFERALDWGSGSGAIGAALSLLRPGVPVNLVDSDAMAVLASRETLAANDLDPGRVHAGDGVPPGIYDLIVSNPPFHAGIETSRDATRSFIREAGSRLSAGGRLVLVTNAFLTYGRELEECIGPVRTLGVNERYRVTEATRSGGSSLRASP